MIRTQIYIPREIHHQLTRLASSKKEPMAKVVRQFIEEGLNKAQTKDLSGKRTLHRIANLRLKGGPRDLSRNLDHYLYGSPKK
ncbi:MAG: hypothetical protein A2900_00600 [Candidatus Chisholmbacteria bacterium RIFCSPLOWO2_01_FULL_50_28]|nr:MAG: hypothetical protein A2900_00600 [Candidatus Chisholmbacteria bacterium RIFCSPLOWO2_01_FULL_50_28]